MPIRITGLNSGLDTEAIISALVSSYNFKTQKYTKAQTKLSWKQDAWKTLNTKIYSLYNSVGNLRFSSAYNLKTSTVSDSTKVSVTAGSNSVNGSYSVQVTSLAKSGYLTGAQLKSGTKGSTKLSDLGYTDDSGKISVTVGGKSKDIAVTKDMTVQEVVNKLKDSGVNASFDEKNGRIFVSAKEAGKANDFSLSGSNTSGTAALTCLGLNVESVATTEEYAALAEYSDKTIDELKAIVAKKADAKNENINLKKIDSYYTKAINYAKAYEAVSKAEDGKSAADIAQLKVLMEESSLTDKYIDADGKIYTKDAEGNYSRLEELTNGTYDEENKTYTTADGTVYNDVEYKGGKYYEKVAPADESTLVSASERYEALKQSFFAKKDDDGNVVTDADGKPVVDDTALVAYKKNVATMKSIEKEAATASAADVKLADGTADELALNVELSALLEEAKNMSAADFETTYKEMQEKVADEVSANEATIAADPKLTAEMTDDDVAAFLEKAKYAKEVQDDPSKLGYNSGATRVDATDATIFVNGAKYTSDSNTFAINGMTFTANAITATDENNLKDETAVNVTVNTDVQGIYDKIKDFLTQYNELINEMTKLYNAESAKGYDPLTDEEKDAMSDTEIEKWEAKIKDSLLRRDDTLSGVISAMTSSMSKGVSVNGKTMYLSDFGIKTLGFLNAPKNEHNAYHIDGDEDDVNTSGNADKLMAAIADDPDSVLDFMKGLATNLYDAVDKKMRATSLSSTYTVYNDKEMASEYSDYTSLIRKWQERLEQQEEYYYKKFAAMETALSKINSQSSSFTGMFG